MGTAFPFIYVLSAVLGIVALIAAFILHKKTRALSTLTILIGYLIAIVPFILWLPLYAYDAPKNLMEIITIIPYISSPLTVIGFFIYAVKLKSN